MTLLLPVRIGMVFERLIKCTGLWLRVFTKKIISYLSTKTYVVGTQKNHLNEMVLLSTKNICLN